MRAFYEAQALTAVFMVGNRIDDETPETLSVIQFREMAKLVDDDVIGNICREKHDFVIEIYVAFRRAAAPAGFMILYEHFPYLESVDVIEMPDALMHKCASVLAHAQILLTIPTHPDHLKIIPKISQIFSFRNPLYTFLKVAYLSTQPNAPREYSVH